MSAPKLVQRVATCGYCQQEDDADAMSSCWNCAEYTCEGCKKDTGRCSHCGISDAEIRIMANND